MELMKLQPIPKTAVWGGNVVGKTFGYEGFPENAGQCWGAVARDSGTNLILDGPYRGRTLKDLWENNHELFNTETERFPWIIGYDAPSDNLSIQVHPGAEYVEKHHVNDSYKNEGWYFYKAAPGARIVLGHNAATREEFIQMVREDRWEELLQHRDVYEEDFINVPAGTLHALCGGIIVYEIQMNSELTYRLYDYHRKDANGQERELHVEAGLECVNIPSNDAVTEHVNKTVGVRTLISNQDYELRLITVEDELDIPALNTFSVITMLEGHGTVNGKEVSCGDYILVLGEGDFEFKGEFRAIICNEKKF